MDSVVTETENTRELKQVLSQRVRELEEYHATAENGGTPLQAAIAKIDEMTKSVLIACTSASVGLISCVK